MTYPGRCTTHHGCKCREWANAQLPQAEADLQEALGLLDALDKEGIVDNALRRWTRAFLDKHRKEQTNDEVAAEEATWD